MINAIACSRWWGEVVKMTSDREKLVCLSQLAGLSCRQLAGTCLAWCFFFFSRFLVAVFFEGQAGFLGQLLGLF